MITIDQLKIFYNSKYSIQQVLKFSTKYNQFKLTFTEKDKASIKSYHHINDTNYTLSTVCNTSSKLYQQQTNITLVMNNFTYR